MHSQKRRLWTETVAIDLKIGDGVHHLDVSLSYDGPHPYNHDTAHLHEITFVGRGKIGHGLDQLLVDLGIQLSRAIQGRNPNTGETIN